jgi:hypothetical protein
MTSKNKTVRTLGRGGITSRKPTQPHATQSDTSKDDRTQRNPTQYNTTKHNTSLVGELPHSAQIRIDPFLFDEIKNAIDSAILGGNYTMSSTSHFLREALRDHSQGKPLSAAYQGSSKKVMSIRLDDKLMSFWGSLPKRHRHNILERAVRTKLMEYNS